jgi:enoyl-CoA hydratase
MGTPGEPVATTVEDGVAVVRIDDGKMNAISHGMLAALNKALDEAESDATSVCIIGNARALSAGFDLAVMTRSPDDARDLVAAGAELLMRLYGHEQPTVVALTGHALAAGALLALACDLRIAAAGPSKIGLNEVAIGMALPIFGLELARDRLSKRFLTRATIEAEVFDVDGALAAGYVDRVVPADGCVATALEEARRLGQLRIGAHGRTKRTMRQATIDHVLATLAADMSALLPPPN